MIKRYQNKKPSIAKSAWIAQSAEIIGSVELKENVSVWYHSVLRGDNAHILIEEDTNIQDGCILHCDPEHELHIGQRVSVGHGCILHGCIIESDCLIGMGAILMNGAHIGANSIIGAGAIVTEMSEIPAGSLVVGCPARIIRNVSASQIKDIQRNAAHYVELKEVHRKEEEYHG